jgi:hypothetical protein
VRDTLAEVLLLCRKAPILSTVAFAWFLGRTVHDPDSYAWEKSLGAGQELVKRSRISDPGWE